MATGKLSPIGDEPLLDDGDILGGYHTVADVTARDAIPTERRRAGMLVWVEADQQTYKLGPGLGNGDWAVPAPVATDNITLYVSEVNGSDANDGLTPGTAKATPAGAWAALPDVVGGSVGIHFGEHSGAGYAWSLPVDKLFLPGVCCAIFGDGAGQAGEDGFIEVETNTAGAGTDSLNVELGAAVGVDAYRGYTVEFTDGAAAGYRRTIRSNTTTVVQVCSPFHGNAGVVAPAPGDTYRIIRPSVILIIPPGTTYHTSLHGVFSERDAIHPVNIGLSAAADTRVTFADGTSAFGLEFDTNTSFYAGSGDFYAGIDGLPYMGTEPHSTVSKVFDLIGHTRVSGGGDWFGWGMGLPGTTASSRLNFRTQGTARFVGFVVMGRAFLQGISDVLFAGGSATGVSAIDDCHYAFNAFTLYSLTAMTAPSFLIRSTGGSNIGLSCARNSFGFAANGPFSGVPLVIENSTSSSTAMALNDVSRFQSSGPINITNTGAAGGKGLFIGGAASMQLLTYTSTISVTSASGVPLEILGGKLALDFSGSLSFSGSSGAIVRGGQLVLGSGTAKLLFTASAGAALVLDAGATLTIAGSGTVLTGEVASAGAVQVLGASRVSQLSGNLSAINTNAGGDGLEVRAGSVAALPGGASTTATGRYGVNSRFGGRVFFAAQPTAVVGTTADLTVGAGGGEDQPDTVLSASASSLVSADTLSSISRST